MVLNLRCASLRKCSSTSLCPLICKVINQFCATYKSTVMVCYQLRLICLSMPAGRSSRAWSGRQGGICLKVYRHPRIWAYRRGGVFHALMAMISSHHYCPIPFTIAASGSTCPYPDIGSVIGGGRLIFKSLLWLPIVTNRKQPPVMDYFGCSQNSAKPAAEFGLRGRLVDWRWA